MEILYALLCGLNQIYLISCHMENVFLGFVVVVVEWRALNSHQGQNDMNEGELSTSHSKCCFRGLCIVGSMCVWGGDGCVRACMYK